MEQGARSDTPRAGHGRRARPRFHCSNYTKGTPMENPVQPPKLLPKRNKFLMIRLSDQESSQISAAALEAGASSVAGYSRDQLLHPTADTPTANPVAEGIQTTRDEIIRLNGHLEHLTPNTFTEPHMAWARDAYGNVQALLEEINQDRRDALDQAHAAWEQLSSLIERQQQEVTAVLWHVDQILRPPKAGSLLDR